MSAYEDGWSGYYDQNDAMGQLYGQMSGLSYAPDLAPVGHASAYYPRDTSGDAAALNFLGFYSDEGAGMHIGTQGSAAADQAQQTGAWDPSFQTAVRRFQESTRGALSVDGWIGPSTRTALSAAVAAKNAQESPIAPPFFPPNPLPMPSSPTAPFSPAVLPSAPSAPSAIHPASAQAAKPNYMLYGGLALAALAVGYGVYKMA